MRLRTWGGALAVAACLGLAACAGEAEPAGGAEGPAQTAPADPSASPTAESTEAAEPSTAAPSPPPEDSVARPDHVHPAPEPARPSGPAPTAPAPSSGPTPDPSAGATPSPSTGPTTSPSPPGTPSTPTPAPTRPPAPEPVDGPSAALAFGQTYEWNNGLAVTAAGPAQLAARDQRDGGGTQDPPSATAPDEVPSPEDPTAPRETDPSEEPAPTSTAPGATAPGDAGTVVAVDVLLVNGTDEPVNTSIYVAMTSGGADAPLVYAPEAGLTGPPGTTIQPGEDVSFTMGFEAQDPDDLTMEVRPAYHYVSALFVHPATAQG